MKPPAILVVLMYHSVKDSQKGRFAEQMNEILKAGIPQRVDEIDHLKRGKRYIAVTFDDGFQSVVKNALPALIERNIPAAVFITTGFLNKEPGWITNRHHENANECILSAEGIRELPVQLITVGSHSVTHPRLSTLGKEVTFRELVDSKKTLEDLLDREIDLFSLPYGSGSDRTTEISKEVGYKHVFLNIPVHERFGRNGYVVGRLHVSPEDWRIEYRLKVLGAYQWLCAGVAIKRKLMGLTGAVSKREGRSGRTQKSG